MFTEILKVIPKLDDSAVANMTRSLTSRFAKVAKTFGGGMISALKGGGYVAIATALVNKVLNPLEHVQEVLDKTLSKGSDLATFAEQFDTTAGKLARLEALGQATGLDSEGVRTLLLKFQAAVSKTALNPDDPSSVRQFVGRKDTADAFFDFIQNRKKLGTTQKNLVDLDVFGERQIGRASEFLNANHKQVLGRIGGQSADQLTGAALFDNQHKSALQERDAKRDLEEFYNNSTKINEAAINSIARRADQKSKSDTSQLADFKGLNELQIRADKLMQNMEKTFEKIAPYLVPALEAIPAILEDLRVGNGLIKTSRVIRGMVPGQGKDK